MVVVVVVVVVVVKPSLLDAPWRRRLPLILDALFLFKTRALHVVDDAALAHPLPMTPKNEHNGPFFFLF